MKAIAMCTRVPSILAATIALTVFFGNGNAFARGGGRGGGGGGMARGGGGGSFSRPSGGGGSFSRPSGGDSFSGSSGGSLSRPSQLPSGGSSRPSGGWVPSSPAQRPAGGDRPAFGGGASQLPATNRASQLPARPVTGGPGRPSAQPGQRPSRADVGNFLGVAGAAAAGGTFGGALANRPSQLPADGGTGQAQRQIRPEQRPNWSQRSQNRNQQWQQRVENRNQAWNQRSERRQQARSDFQQNRDQRWSQLQNAQQNRQAWRDHNREDWQKHRQKLWDYRGDRAEEIWDNTRDFYDDVFDDRWWGRLGWGYGWSGSYPSNPWWWWVPAGWGAVSTFVRAIAPDPVYIDYGMNVIYEGQTVYVDDQPIPADQYSQPMMDLAVYAEQAPPPVPPAQGQPAEWLPLGVFALAQEEKGDPVMFFQISVNRAGVINGAYNSAVTSDQRQIAGQVDKASQRVAWRIGANTDTIFVTSLANLTQDVSPLTIKFGSTRTQTWLLVRMPEPAAAGQPQVLPEAPTAPPPLGTAKAK